MESNIQSIGDVKNDPYVTRFTYKLGDQVTMLEGFYRGYISSRQDSGHVHYYRIQGFNSEGSIFDEWFHQEQIDKPKPTKKLK